MAKGDHARSQNQADYQGGYARDMLDNTFNNLLPQNQNLQNRFTVAANQGEQDYGNIMGQYGSFLNQSPVQYNAPRQNFGAYSGYQDFANTGGFSDQNISDIRARSNAPIRGIYEQGIQNIDRNRSLSGGYSPNANAAQAKMAREMSYAAADQSLNTEARLAEAIRSGKLAGLGGMTGIDTSRMSEGLQNAAQDVSTQLANRSQGLQAISGMRDLYGTAPGAAGMYGQLLGQSNAQMNDIQQLRQALANMMIQAQLGVSNVPGNYQQALGNIGGTLGLLGQGAGMASGLGGLFGGSGGLSGLPGGSRGPF